MKKTASNRKASTRLAAAQGSAAEWEQDGKDFDAYQDKQRYSLGAMPTWTQIGEMRRTWQNARRTLRKQQNQGVTN